MKIMKIEKCLFPVCTIRICLGLLLPVVMLLPVSAQTTVAEGLKTTAGLTVFSRLIEAAGLSDTLSKVKDETFEALKQSGHSRVADLPGHPSYNNREVGHVPEHRYYGYTIFAETDDFWRAELGKEPGNISAADVQAWVVSKGFYSDAKDNTDYSDADNVLNQFVTYHILPVCLSADKLVIHHNERGYNYRTSTQYTVPTYELYTTMGKRRLLKLYQCGPAYSINGDDKIYLNRFPQLADGRHENYAEVSVTPQTEGIVVNTENLTEFTNACVYPIDKALAYDEATRDNFHYQRLRFDVAGLFPEFMNNDIRANRNRALCIGIPVSKNYPYLDDLEVKEGTKFYYLSGLGLNWYNWQGDEFNVVGSCDFTLRLPPVPHDGEYELRLATQSNSSLRGIVQFYVGLDKDNPQPAGWPMDMREGGTVRKTAAGNFPSSLGWESDVADDDIYSRLVDLRLYEKGVLKGPANYAFTPGGSNYARDNETTLRRIIWRGEAKADETLYLRVRSMLDDESREFYMDYLEWCPATVYDNPDKPEDIW